MACILPAEAPARGRPSPRHRQWRKLWRHLRSQPNGGAALTGRTIPGWRNSRRSRSSIRICRSSTRTIICGSGRASRYLLDELLADTNTGHNIEATVFRRMPLDVPRRRTARTAPGRRDRVRQRRRGDERAAAATARRGSAPASSAMPICRLASGCEPVLEAHIRAGGGRFRGIRHIAGWDADPTLIGNSRHATAAASLWRTRTSATASPASRRWACRFDAWLYHPQLADVIDLARAFPDDADRPRPCRRRARHRPLCRQARRGVRALEAVDDRAWRLPERRRQARRHGDAGSPPSTSTSARGAAILGSSSPAAGGPTSRPASRLFGADRCMFESNFPVDKVGTGYAMLWNAFKRIAAGASPDEKTGFVQRHRPPRLPDRRGLRPSPPEGNAMSDELPTAARVVGSRHPRAVSPGKPLAGLARCRGRRWPARRPNSASSRTAAAEAIARAARLESARSRAHRRRVRPHRPHHRAIGLGTRPHRRRAAWRLGALGSDHTEHHPDRRSAGAAPGAPRVLSA